MTDIYDQKIDLKTTLAENKLVILNFWESWCGPCKVELPDLQKMYETHHGKGLEIVGIFSNSSRASVDEVVTEHALGFPIIEDKDGKLSKPYRVTAVPTTIVMESDGTIIRSTQGLDVGLSTFIQKHLEGNDGSSHRN